MAVYKILGLGDSITVGNQGVGNAVVASYRLRLSKMLAALIVTPAGAALFPDGFNFVGATTTVYTPPVAPSTANMPFRGNYADPWGGFSPGIDNKHSGVGSETIAQVLARKGDITTYAPDCVVFEAGTNDIAGGTYATGTTADAWAQGIRDMQALLPANGFIAAVDIPPLFNGTVAVARALNAAPCSREMQARVATLRGEGRPVQMVSIQRRLPIAFGFADGVHPDRWGFDAFAIPVLAAILQHRTGNQLAMTLAQQIDLAPLIRERVRVLAYRMCAVWQLQSADSTRIYAPASGDATALAAILSGSQRLLAVVSQQPADRQISDDALVKLVTGDGVVLGQYAAALGSGTTPEEKAAAAAAVTDAALEDAVYQQLRYVWGITVAMWPKPS